MLAVKGLVPWTPHPEVWVLVIGALAIGWYSAKVLQPKAIAAGYPALRRGQKIWFTLGILGIWGASDWPMHDIAEGYLYSVHMMQHLLLSMIVPGCFVLATPRWVFELLVRPGSELWNRFKFMSHPVVAGLLFNFLTMFLHWTSVVQWSADSAALHFGFHIVIFVSGLLMWMPVVGPIQEWKLPPLGQCVYLFLMSVVPTIPGGWLVFADDVVYRHYDTPFRLWGLDVLEDQQLAGAIMKLVGGWFIWLTIIVIFSRWVSSKDDSERDAVRERHRRNNRLPEQLSPERLTSEQSSDTAQAHVSTP